MSDSVAAQTRAANVDAFIVWSACSTRQVSRISASRSAGAAPRSWSRKFAARLRPGSEGGQSRPCRAAWYAATRIGCWAVSRAAFRALAAAALESLSGSSALASETRLRSASIGLLRRGDLRQRGADQLAQGAPADQFGPVAVQLGPAGRRAALQQVADLLEGRGPGQLMDVVTAIEQQARLAINVAQRGGCGDDVSQALGRLVRHFVYLPMARSAVYFRPPQRALGPAGSASSLALAPVGCPGRHAAPRAERRR